MAVSVFISSTGVDLEEDCRPCVRRAITEGGAVEVCMESWVTDFVEAEKVCRRKLRGSSHYLGIFAYWRGSSPPGQERSYTEAEFDWACEPPKKTMAVLLPKAATPYDRKLRRRAKSQDVRAAEVQKKFVDRVRATGVTMDFNDLPHLAQKTAQLMSLWQGGGVVGEGRRAGAGGLTPKVTDLAQIGRRALVSQYERTFDIIGGEGLPEVVGFLIHGPLGYGHAQAVKRLCDAFEKRNDDSEDATPPRRIVMPVGGYWDGGSLNGLLSAFGRQVERDWEPATVEEIAARVIKLLKSEDVILEINDLQRYSNGRAVSSFVEQFWKPLAKALGGQANQHRLAAFMSFEGAPEPDWGACTFEPDADDDSDFELSRPVRLPALEAFTAQELTAWLRAWLRGAGAGGDAAQQLRQAQSLAATLVAETGGEPLKVYSKLSATVWI